MDVHPDQSNPKSLPLHVALVAFLVFLGCYAGAFAATLLKFPSVGTAVIFLPYAVIAAALMLSPKSTWWLYLSAAAAGDLFAHFQREGLTAFVPLAEIANTFRAVVAAWGVQRFSRQGVIFKFFQGTIVYLLFAVVLGPAVGAFVGAFAVTLRNPAAEFWIAWQAWLLSNMLTGLTLLPLILVAATTRRRTLKRISLPRLVEAAVLAGAVLVTGAYTFTSSMSHVTAPASWYLPLPLLLWAAVRFSTRGIVLALCTLTALTIGGALDRAGPFAAGVPAEDILHLQYFLIAMCTPLLLLASLVQQQMQTAAELRQSQSDFRTVLEDQSEMICRFLQDGTTTFVNGAFCRHFKRSRDELLKQKIWELIPAESAAPLRACLASIDAQHTTARLEVEKESDRGEIQWQEWIYRGLFNDSGQFLAYQAVGRDISEHRQSEKSLKTAVAEVSRLKERVEAQNAYLQEELSSTDYVGEIICRSTVMRQTLAQVQRVAATDTTVLIFGETGTGKELIARTIHETSNRKNRPFVRLNCAALPIHLIESELFGHERGAFTGAVARRLGRFEIANGATLFLDEMGELPLELQAKLLRVLQEGECERLGSSETIKVDVRLIVATNRNLADCVKRGTFRADLYYRLNVFPVTIPPLRARSEDIIPLATVFLSECSHRLGRTFAAINNATAKSLLQHSWPGNVRELENLIERAAISSKQDNLELPDAWEGDHPESAVDHASSLNAVGVINSVQAPSLEKPLIGVASSTIQEMERNHILAILERTKWRIEGPSGAAVILGIKGSTLRFRMKKLGIVRA